MLENNLNKFIAIQKRNYYMYYLKKAIRQKLQIMTIILIIRNRLMTLTQHKKNSQIFKIELKNKFQNDQNFNFETRSK